MADDTTNAAHPNADVGHSNDKTMLTACPPQAPLAMVPKNARGR